MTYTPRGYKAKDVIPESDVLDTWATSSISPRIIAELVNNDSMRQKVYPASLRPNAFEIIRTWDFYSIVRGYYNNGNLPFHNIMISGHGLAEDGRKMSKRLGNYIPSEELVDKYGADAIRYWATGAQLGQNLRFNIKEIEVGHRTAVKLYNVARFLQMHIDKSGKEKYEHADIWILTELNNTINKATSAFDKYKFSQARDAVDSFFWSKFTDNYIEFVKYRLFGDNIESSNAAAATLRLVFEAILKLYAPIMPFITEEIYQDLFSKDTSIHKSLWPVLIEIEPELDIQDFQDALKAIEEIRKFKASQNMSLGKELDNYSLKQHINHEKYAKLVAGVMRIHNLTV
jgi:valyl-tRNA synthetase